MCNFRSSHKRNRTVSLQSILNAIYWFSQITQQCSCFTTFTAPMPINRNWLNKLNKLKTCFLNGDLFLGPLKTLVWLWLLLNQYHTLSQTSHQFWLFKSNLRCISGFTIVILLKKYNYLFQLWYVVYFCSRLTKLCFFD